MTLRTFYKNFENQNFLAKKLFSNIIYSKHLVRSNQKLGNSIQILDNFSSFFSVANNLKLGFSLSTTKVIFRHKHDDRVRFNYFLNYSIFRSKNSKSTSKLYYALRFLGKNKACLMLLLHPIRGGFKAYSCGFLGFLPRGQAKTLYKKFWLINHSKKKSFLSNSFLLLAKNHIFKFFFPFNVLLKFAKIVIYVCFRIYNFSSRFAKRRRRFFETNFNFVFLLRKHNKKVFKAIKKRSLNHANSTSKKKLKSSYNNGIFSKQQLRLNKKSKRKIK
jgi:hypothetical protein